MELFALDRLKNTPIDIMVKNGVSSFYAPNFEKVGSILLSACPCVRPSVQKN